MKITRILAVLAMLALLASPAYGQQLLVSVSDTNRNLLGEELDECTGDCLSLVETIRDYDDRMVFRALRFPGSQIPLGQARRLDRLATDMLATASFDDSDGDFFLILPSGDVEELAGPPWGGRMRMLHAIDAPDVVGIDAPDVVGIPGWFRHIDAPDVVGIDAPDVVGHGKIDPMVIVSGYVDQDGINIPTTIRWSYENGLEITLDLEDRSIEACTRFETCDPDMP
jgi:hypothetical protein